jgi:HK97 family phage portal protein
MPVLEKGKLMKKIIKKLLGNNLNSDINSNSYNNVYTRSHYHHTSSPIWMDRTYERFSDEAYIKNVIANRAINLISHAADSINPKLFFTRNSHKRVINDHKILELLRRPNPSQSGREFLETIYSNRQISGNAFVMAVTDKNNIPIELYALRPDRISIIPGKNFIPSGYCYKINEDLYEYKVDPITGHSHILHIKNFHPLNDWYGLSAIEAAAYSIDQHNQAGAWNQALLQNGARPSGAIVVRGENGKHINLNEKQFQELKRSIDDIFSGPKNAGKPLLLEGGLDWKEMSLSPKDMDFIESKHSSARDIALAFGVPPQLLGIPGDNTYSNLQEARLALWEQTILPMVENVTENLSNWFKGFWGASYELTYDSDSISALSERREALWERINNCNFMTINEKRSALGLSPLEKPLNTEL